MLYTSEFPSLGFFVFVYSSPFLQSIILESYAGSLIVLSLQTPDTVLAVPWDTKVNPALEAPGIPLDGQWWGEDATKMSLESLYSSLCWSSMRKISMPWSARLYGWITGAARFAQLLFSPAFCVKTDLYSAFLCGNLVAGCGGEAAWWLILQGIPWWIRVFLLLDLYAVSFNAGASSR